MLISIFKNSLDNTSEKYVKYTSALGFIKKGNYKEKIERIRNGEKGKDKIKKLELPAVTFSGVFEKKETVDKRTGEIKLVSRNIANLKEYSKLIVIDIDGLESVKKASNLKKKFMDDPFVHCCFFSPSFGLKILFKVSSDYSLHKEAFRQLKQYCEDVFGCKVDKSGSDVSRLCYLSYDPELYFNPKSLVFEVTKPKNDFVRAVTRDVNLDNISYDLDFIWNVSVKIMEKNGDYFVKGNRNEYIHKISCVMNRAGVGCEQIVNAITSNHSVSRDFYEELVTTVNGVGQRNKHEFGSKPFEDNRKKRNTLF